ncbi:MAG: small ribosomal subunit Rsm22 family protein [Spirochaetales bacterium]|nr:small ribosomal subunit Rsm22 family protein [Spirochaetales bacterium]
MNTRNNSNNKKESSKKITTKKQTEKLIKTKDSKSNSSFNSNLFDTRNLNHATIKILNSFDEIIQNVRPLNSRQLQQLPENIRKLSHQLTDDRASRRLGYMNDNIQLSSYVRYYTWWNLVRLTRLFANLPSSVFPSSDCTCIDLGSGPLTVVTALWLARPELRKLKLTWYCLDVSANSLTLGEDIFLSIAAKTSEDPWNIIRIKGNFGTQIKQKAGFLTCANMLNELDQASDMPPEFQTKNYYEHFERYCEKGAGIILVEPGVPKAARTLSLLRARYIKDGRKVTAPCTHECDCPMSGFKAYTGSKNKWCNFAFTTEDAPLKLQKLSDLAKLPKERATLSFIAVEDARVKHGQTALEDKTFIRITSDKLRLPNYMCGFYGCSQYGLVLITLPDENNTRLPKPRFRPKSGDLISVKIKTPDSLPVDEKSGALIIEL